MKCHISASIKAGYGLRCLWFVSVNWSRLRKPHWQLVLGHSAVQQNACLLTFPNPILEHLLQPRRIFPHLLDELSAKITLSFILYQNATFSFKIKPRACGHYNDVIMSTMACQITGVLIVYSTICSVAYQRKQQSSASLSFVRGILRTKGQ